MLGTQCVLALVALYVGLAHSWSWDIVVRTSDTQHTILQFFVNNTMTHSEAIPQHYYPKTYDAVNNRLLFSTYNSHSKAYDIASMNLETMEIQTLVKCGARNIWEIAFDPVNELLFWSDYITDSIYWYSLIPGSQNNPNGNVLFKLEAGSYNIYIDVDSCRGYIYWQHYERSTNRSLIERVRFNGTEREVLIEDNGNYINDVVIDQQTQKMYWIEEERGTQGSIISADLTGKNRTLLYFFKSSRALSLAVSKDYIYTERWSELGKLSKKSMPAVHTRLNLPGRGEFLVANYKIEEQIQGIQDCKALKSLLPAGEELVCVHGTKVSGESLCKCTHGYTGERCDVSVCLNYCLEGNCTVSADGQPKCSCNAGYSGTTCEVNACHEYCLNSGICSLNESSQPVCQCKKGYEGARCNVSVCQNYCLQGNCRVNTLGQPKCSCNTDHSGTTCEVNVCHEYCLNSGICSLNENNEPVCQCKEDYEGARCGVSVCHNYCFRGNCSVRAEGQPECSCSAGYTGERCEVNTCQGYCFNSGVCSLNKNTEPVCQCKEGYTGERCDVSVLLIKCFQAASMLRDIPITDVTLGTLDNEVESTSASTIV